MVIVTNYALLPDLYLHPTPRLLTIEPSISYIPCTLNPYKYMDPFIIAFCMYAIVLLWLWNPNPPMGPKG